VRTATVTASRVGGGAPLRFDAGTGPAATRRIVDALVFGVDSGCVPPGVDAENLLLTNLAATPMALRQLPDPALLGDDWVVLQTRLTGICGSDSKQHETGAIKVAFDFR
jgi:hypothetical protein